MNAKIIFDFDSTIIGLESLDEIAKEYLKNHHNKKILEARIEEITNLGMGGELDFEKSLRQRIGLIHPSMKEIEKTLEKIQKSISKSFLKNKNWIKENKENLFVISGGFKEIIIPICKDLGFKEENIFGNEFVFNSLGKVEGFKENLLLAQNQGKVKQVKSLKLKHGFKGKILVVGDGSTDLEIKKHQQADYFIYYQEHVKREKVSQSADFAASSLDEVIDFVNNGI